MFCRKHPQPVFQTKTGVDGAVVKRRLSVDVEFGGPPGCRAVLEFNPVGNKRVAEVLRSKGREILDLEIAGFFQVMVVRDDIGTFLGHGKHRKQACR
jgi:hypothetical protein